MKKSLSLLIWLVLISASYPQKLKKISFALNEIPQAQFAGYFIGMEMGVYKKYGIDLEIITEDFKKSASTHLKDAKRDFFLLTLTKAIQLKEKGSTIVNISQLINRSALMLIAKKTSDINTPQDMKGKKIGILGGDFQIQPLAFFKKYNLNVQTVPQGNTVNLFFFDGIDVISGRWYNEYHTILNSGYREDELSTFFFSDHDLNFPEEGIYCSAELLQRESELCESFLKATLESWQYTFNNPEEALNIIIKHIKKLNLPSNKTHQRWMLNRMKDLIFPNDTMNQFEILQKENFMLVAEILRDSKIIKSIPAFQDFYKPIKITRTR